MGTITLNYMPTGRLDGQELSQQLAVPGQGWQQGRWSPW